MKTKYLYLSFRFLFGKIVTTCYLHFVLVVYAKYSPNFIPEPTLDLPWLYKTAYRMISENISSSNKLVYYVALTFYPQHYYGGKSRIMKQREHVLRIGRWEVKCVHEVCSSNLNQNDPIEITHKWWNGLWGNIVWDYGLSSCGSGQQPVADYCERGNETF
jgi:hypothetical protein